MSNISVGVGTYGHEYINIHDLLQGTKLIIGNYCSIAANNTVLLGGNHRYNRVTTYPFQSKFHIGMFKETDGYSNGDVVIGNDVWIGNGCTILSGINIGDGSIIAAGSHVVTDVEPYSIIGGNPAKLIKKRFSDTQITALLEIKWWNWDFDKINKYINYLLDPDIDAFINIIKQEN